MKHSTWAMFCMLGLGWISGMITASMVIGG